LDVDRPHAHISGILSSVLSCYLGCEGSTLTRPFEPDPPGRGPTHDGALRVGNGYQRIVERRFDVGHTVRNNPLFLLPPVLASAARFRHPSPLFLFLDLLLTRDRSTPRSLSGSRIGVRSLSSQGEIPPVTHPPVGADFDQTPDVLSDLLPQITFDPTLILDDLPDTASLIFGEVLDLDCCFDPCRLEDLPRPGAPDTVNVCQANPDLFARRQIDTCYSRHGYTLPLSLLVFRVLTDHPYDTVAPDDLALRTHSLD
jgi:hypothetical protein